MCRGALDQKDKTWVILTPMGNNPIPRVALQTIIQREALFTESHQSLWTLDRSRQRIKRSSPVNKAANSRQRALD
jgi:hypothetical protein